MLEKLKTMLILEEEIRKEFDSKRLGILSGMMLGIHYSLVKIIEQMEEDPRLQN